MADGPILPYGHTSPVGYPPSVTSRIAPGMRHVIRMLLGAISGPIPRHFATILESPVWRMGRNVGQSGRQNGGREGEKVSEKQRRIVRVYA